MSRYFLAVQVSALLCLGAAVGCGAREKSASVSPMMLEGKVHGGNQPVAGAAIQLYAAGSTGYASAATPLLTLPVFSLPDGSFSITGEYACPSATTQVYLTASGGNPGLAPGTNNTALAMMAALGNCGSLTSTTYITVNEVSTVAAVFSLAPFMTGTGNVGTSATNAAGLQNAMLSPGIMVPTATGAAAISTSTNIQGYQQPGTQMPTAKIDTLGDVLAACVNSDGSTSAGMPCGLLFAATTPAGGSAPTDTVQAALSMAQHLTTGVNAQIALSAANAPFQPTLTAAPADWALGYGSVQQEEYVNTAALDGLGDFWSAGFYENAPGFISGSGPDAGFARSSSSLSFGMALDQNENLWLLSAQSANGSASGVYEVSPSGSNLPCSASCGPYTFANDYIFSIAVDRSNRVWMVGANGTLYEMTTSGTLLSPPGGYTGLGLDSNYYGYIFEGQGPTRSPHMAFDNNGALWVTSGISGALTKIVQSGTGVTAVSYTGGNLVNPEAIAIDHSGGVWVGSNGPESAPAPRLTKFNPDGSVALASFMPATGCGSTGLAIDGGGNLWTTGNCVYSAAGVALAGALGDGYAHLGSEVAGVDASGSVWSLGYAYSVSAYTKLVGVAVPTGTSLSEALAAGTLGARP